ncbi:MAG: RNA polymerase factor sigma-54 [Pseudorhodobacter sp.]|nr:RNA polymerase factor sigma-54 [Pseudorhodobacter sp.]
MENHHVLQMLQTRSLTMTTELRHAIGLLRLNNQELAAYAVAFAVGNPHLRLTQATHLTQALNWLDAGRLPDELARVPGREGVGTTDTPSPGNDAESVAAPAEGLHAHVAAQIALLVRDHTQRTVALAYAEALEPSGWLACQPADIAHQCGCSLAIAESVLRQLQQIEPAGLFARSLAECLALQAADQAVLTPAFERLLAHLPLLARGDLGQLAQICGCSAETLAQMLRVLRAMDPKPGAQFDPGPDPVHEPDLIVRREAGRWLVELNRSTLPEIEVRDDIEVQAGAGDDPLRAARWLQRAVLRRNATTLRIGVEVVRRQAGFLRDGPARLQPLSFADIAGATGLHVSTVSRVTAGLMVATPRRTLLLRDFFSAALRGSSGEAGVATATLLHELHQLIGHENPAAPLSDAAIVRHFHSRGITVARRTVAKYRAELHLAGSAARKRMAVPKSKR